MKRWMKRWIVAFVLVMCAAVPGWAFKRVHVGDPHRDFTLEDLEGSPVHLAESLGAKATVVVFWAGWSPRSSEALRDYQALYAAHRDEGLQVVAVDVAHQQWHGSELPGIQRFVADLGLGFPVVIDRDLSVFNDYGVIAVPSTALLDGSGKIVALLEGYATTTRDDFRDRVLETLGVQPAAPVVSEKPDAYRPKGKAERYLRMAEILIDREMPRKAVHILERAIREDPDWPKPYGVLAEVFDGQGRSDEAAEAGARYAELTGAVAEPPETTAEAPAAPTPRPVEKSSPAAVASAARYLRMGALFFGKGMPAQAEKSFRKAVTMVPDSVEAHRKLAEALAAQGKTEAARAERQRADNLRAGSPEGQGEPEVQALPGDEASVASAPGLERAGNEPREAARPPVAPGAVGEGGGRQDRGVVPRGETGASRTAVDSPRERATPEEGGAPGPASRSVPTARSMDEEPPWGYRRVDQRNPDPPDPQEKP